MATVAQIALALDAVRNLANLRRDIKANLSAYAEEVAKKDADLAVVQRVLEADASEYIRRLDWHSDEALAGHLVAGMEALGVEDFASDWASLRAAAEAQAGLKIESKEAAAGQLSAIDNQVAEAKVLFQR